MADKQPNLIKFSDFIPEKTIRCSKKPIENKDYNFKRIPITDKDGNDIYLTTHVGQFRFCELKDRDNNEGSMFKASLECNTENDEAKQFVEKLDVELGNYLLKIGVKNSISWFGEEIDEEIMQEYVKSIIYKPESYPASFGLTIYDYENKNLLLIEPDGTEIENPNLPEKLKSGYQGRLIIHLTSIIIKANKSIKIGIKIKTIGVTEHSEITSSCADITSYEKGSLTLGEIEKKKDKDGKLTGGKFTNGKVNGGRIVFRLKNVSIAPFVFEQQDKVDKSKYNYSANIKLDNPEMLEAMLNLQNDIKDELVKNSKDYYKKKLNSKLIESKLKPFINYSKGDREKIKNGEEPAYSPTVRLMFSKYNNEFSAKAFDKDGKKLDTDMTDFLTLGHSEKKCDSSRKYDMDISLKHIWFGSDDTTIRWDCYRVQLASTVSKPKIRFGDNSKSEKVESSGDDSDANDDSNDDANDNVNDDANAKKEDSGADSSSEEDSEED